MRERLNMIANTQRVYLGTAYPSDRRWSTVAPLRAASDEERNAGIGPAPEPSMPPLAAVLTRAPLLQGLPRADLVRLAGIAQRRAYSRRESLYRAGDTATLIHVIDEGFVKLMLEHDTGDQCIVDILGPGAVLGELGLLDGAPHPWTARALGPVVTVCVPCDAIGNLLRSAPEHYRQALATYRDRVVRLNTLLADASFLSTRERLARRLLDLAAHFGVAADVGTGIALPLVQDDLAALVGATRPTISTCLGELEDAGAIRREQRRIVILSLDALQAAAAIPNRLRGPAAGGGGRHPGATASVMPPSSAWDSTGGPPRMTMRPTHPV